MSGAASRRDAVQRPPIPWLLRGPALLVAAAVAVAWHGAGGDVRALLSADALRTIADFGAGFLHPRVDAEFVGQLGRPLLETVAIAVLGTSLALVLALPLSVLAVRPGVLALGGRPSQVRRLAYLVARLLLNVLRGVPELVWALLFVRALGIGPAPGVLALGLAYAGALGKVYAEIFESTPTAAARALTGAGASAAGAFTFGTVPQALPMLASYGLYRFDCALRASAVLGLVGAGGVGQQIELSLKMLEYGEVATLLVTLFALVAGVDFVSVHLRRWLAGDVQLLPTTRAALARRLAVAAAWGAALVALGAFLELRPSELLSPGARAGMRAFLGGLFPPALDRAFLLGLLPAAGQTLAVSVLGTALAAGAAFTLAVLGTRDPEDAVAARAAAWPVRAAGLLLRGTIRAFFNLTRTLPEVLWALLLIFAVGLGPFAGALALGLHTTGVLGRLYLESLEEAPQAAARALRLAGARPLLARCLGVLPQALPQLVAYTLYRWEVNARASAVLGVVGAGGLGSQLHVALSLFMYDRVATLVAAILALMTAVDLLSGWLRGWIAHGRAPALRAFDDLPGSELHPAAAPAFHDRRCP